MTPQSASESASRPLPADIDPFSSSKAFFLKSVASSWFSEPTTRFWNLLCFSATMLVIVLYGPFAAHEHSFRDLMATRVSGANLLAGGTCVLVWHILHNIIRLPRRPRNLGKHLLGLAVQTTACTGPAGLLMLLRHRNMSATSFAFLFASLSFTLIVLVRLVAGFYRQILQPAIRRNRCVVIVGCGWRGQALAEELLLHPRWRYQLWGFVDSSPPEKVERYLGRISALESVLMSNPIDEVIIALPVKSKYDDIQESITICERIGVQSSFSIDLFSTSITKRQSFDRDRPASVLLHVIHNETGRTIKRSMDILISGLTLLLLSPLLLFVFGAVAFTSKGPAIFRQQRYGLNRRLFNMYKFRSMVVDAEKRQGALEHLNETTGPVFKIKDDPRITQIGKFIRKTSIDELPQLWNVLRGDMSIVGPRPLPMRDVSRFSEAWLMRRFSVLPGITGLWQVSGRSKTNFEDLMRFDLDYIDHWSLLADLRIVLKTIPAVLKGSGAS